MKKKADDHLARTVRLSQIIVPFGVGAIYDFLGESLVCCDTTMWPWERTRTVESRRLAKSLGIGELRGPKTNVIESDRLWKSKLRNALPFCRFPKWLFCQICRRLTHISHDDAEAVPRCERCSSAPQLVPMRFIMICPAGHMGDFPWDYFVHGGGGDHSGHELFFDSDARKGLGLESLSIRCATDDKSRSLQGITSENFVKAMNLKCPCRQPWQKFADKVQCSEQVAVVQRGASNVYFADVRSALEIPEDVRVAPYSDLEQLVRKHPFFSILLTRQDSFVDQMYAVIAAECNCDPLEVKLIVQRAKNDAGGGGYGPDDTVDIAAAEWLAFTTLDDRGERLKNFVARRVPLLENRPSDEVQVQLDRIIDFVATVDRLREVRALNGFSRYKPDGTATRPSLTRNPSWLPAVEAFGEGIFIGLNESLVADWELRDYARERARQLDARKAGSLYGNRIVPGELHPRFVLLHTLAHVLVRQLAFESGYPASSLRERVYARPPSEGAAQAGVLIYTTAGDVEGTMGGLARLAVSSRLPETILSALEVAYWCSSDPLCKETRGQGFNALNFAACHACCLLAETSCVHGNVLLDRNMLFYDERYGFFDGVIATAFELSALNA
jgi:hypothetical protein